jgi:trimethylamine--corrinoid protein Co-methyltransferase
LAQFALKTGGGILNPLKLLSDAEVEALHQAALRILNEVGVTLTHPGARQMLTDAGATVQNERVCLPPELVDACIAKCPPQVHVRGRGGNPQTLGDGSLHFHNLGGARDIHNPTTDEHRFAILQDVRDATRLLDALPSCNTITPFFTPSDVPGKLMTLAMYRHAMPFTTKPLQGPGVQTAPEVRYAVQMAGVIGPPREVLTLSVSPVSPLSFPDHEVEAMLEVARQGIAFAPLPCPTAGTTAPFSIAGGIAQQAAEVLACLVLAQLVRSGLPIIFCGRLAMMEPRTGISVWGGVEMGLASAGTVQLGHRYGLPVNVYGFSTNAHTLDMQNGFERGLNALIPALAGADELSGIGEMEAGVLGTYAQMVADNEFAGSIQRARRGFSTDVDAVAVDVIATVMNGPRNFLGQKHTTRYLKGGEVLLTKLAERSSWETWEQGNRWGLAEQAQAESERILREHQVEPLSDAQEKALDEIMSAAENELVKV